MKLVSEETNAKIVQMFRDGMTVEEISKAVKLHPHSVRRRIRRFQESIKAKMEQKENELTDDLIKQLQGDRPRSIVKKILGIMDDGENLDEEYLARGLDPLNRVLGTLIDKALKLHEIDMKQQMSDKQEVEQDNFFDAMTDALERMTDLDKYVDPDSKDNE